MTNVPGHPAELWQCVDPEELSSSQGAFFGSPGGTRRWAALLHKKMEMGGCCWLRKVSQLELT